jgi:hypothetical protein
MEMTESTKILMGGMIYAYALTAVILLALGSGCIGGQPGYSVYGQNPPATAAQATEQTLTTAPAAPATTQAKTPTTLGDMSQVDFSQVSVSIAGCDNDYYMNALVAGYATNNGVAVLGSVPIVTQLLTSEGDVVSGGEKTTVITNLNPGETQKFSVVYEKPSKWNKCRASVNGNWVTL